DWSSDVCSSDLLLLGPASGAVLGHDTLGDARRLVDALFHRLAFDKILEADDTGLLGDDRQSERVPLGQAIAFLHLRAVLEHQHGTVRHAVDGALTALAVDHDHLAATGKREPPAALVDDRRHVAELHRAVRDGFEVAGLVDLRRAADVEGAHGQLRARLADRLRRDNANGFADVYRRTAGEVTPVALGADALIRLTNQRRANLGRLHFGFLDRLDHRLVEQRARLDDDLVGLRVDQIFGRGAAEDALTQRGNDRTALHDRAHFQRPLGAAVFLDHHAVLRHVDQTTGQVTRVRGLERGVRQALASAVSRVEVLEDGQAFLEVRDDRRLDDLARRLGHQAAHTGELLHLRRRTTRTGVAHHVDRVDRLQAAGVLVHRLRADLVHQGVRHLVAATAPGVDHLVVLFLLSDEAVLVLLLVVGHQRLGLLDQFRLRIRNDHVILAERDAGLERVAEAQRHDGVGKQHRVLLAGVAIDLIDDVADFLLGKKAVDDVERHLVRLRQAFADQHAARGRLDTLHVSVALLVRLRDAADGLRVQRDRADVQRLVHFGDVGEDHALARLDRAVHRQVVQPQHHVLRGHDDRLAVGGAEDVVGRHHQHARFQLRLKAQRDVYGHLVTVEVGVEGGADQRVQLD